MLHLHRLEHDDLLPALHGVTGAHVDRDDRPLDRRRDDVRHRHVLAQRSSEHAERSTRSRCGRRALRSRLRQQSLAPGRSSNHSRSMSSVSMQSANPAWRIFTVLSSAGSGRGDAESAEEDVGVVPRTARRTRHVTGRPETVAIDDVGPLSRPRGHHIGEPLGSGSPTSMPSDPATTGHTSCQANTSPLVTLKISLRADGVVARPMPVARARTRPPLPARCGRPPGNASGDPLALDAAVHAEGGQEVHRTPERLPVDDLRPQDRPRPRRARRERTEPILLQEVEVVVVVARGSFLRRYGRAADVEAVGLGPLQQGHVLERLSRVRRARLERVGEHREVAFHELTVTPTGGQVVDSSSARRRRGVAHQRALASPGRRRGSRRSSGTCATP